MRNRGWVMAGGFLAVALVGFVTFPARAANKDSAVAEEVAVLLKWYHTYFAEGKYPQAQHVAEMAHELAPEDAETKLALKLVRRQLSRTTTSAATEQQLEKVLNKLDVLEKQVEDLRSQKQRLQKQLLTLQSEKQRTTRPPHREPLGSPDAIE